VAELERAVSLRPDDGETRLLLIDAHLMLEDEESAGKVLKAVLKRFPNRPEAQLALGRVNLFNDRLDEAMTAFFDARKLLAKEHAANRQKADVERWIGVVYYYNAKLKAARRALGRALKLDPNQSAANYYMGLIHLDARQWKSATAAFEKTVAADPTGLAEAWFYLGEAARESRKRTLAKRAYKTYVKLVKSGDLSDEAREHLRDMR
jgi:tetratricopeptide (TPR) repeat protein